MVTNTSRATTSTTQDESAIRALYEQVMDGWNKGSGEGFAAPFADDGEQVAFDGTHFQGRQQIAEFHQMLFDRFLRGTRLIGKITDIRFLRPDVALAHAIGGTVMPGQSDLESSRNSVQTLVAVKDNGAWRLASLHNSRAEFISQPEAATAMTAELRQLL
jgi:uncharacterized protein (TIGR02246 family)